MTKEQKSNQLDFDLMAYVTDFDFCGITEKKQIFNALKEAWQWGTQTNTHR